MELKAFLSQEKAKIDSLMLSFIDKKEKENRCINRWTSDYSKRLRQFVANGKSMRGCLVCLGNHIFSEKHDSNAVKAAAAIEMMHSSLLIHDDIMDQDLLRRGMPTIHAQYSALAGDEGIRDPDHFGKSMAICIGDVSLFYTFELLSALDIGYEKKSSIINAYAKELTAVATAQMQDLYAGLSEKDMAEDDIMGIYYYKSARYTFCLPLTAGAIIAGAGKESIECLDKIGESLGIIFQIKDDELGLFGDEKEVGKPIGSDIKEGKQTLYYYHLFRNCSKDESEKLKAIFGNSSITEDDIDYVRSLVRKYKIDITINEKSDELAKSAREQIALMDIKKEHKELLLEMVDLSLKRKR